MSDPQPLIEASEASSGRNYARDTFFYDLLRNEAKAGPWRPTMSPSVSTSATSPSSSGQPQPSAPIDSRRDSLAPHLASPSVAAHDSDETLATWAEKWWRRRGGGHGPLDELVECFAAVVRIASALHSRHLALVVARPDMFSVQFPVVQLRTFSGVVELPGWERGRAAGSLSNSAAYIEHRTLDALNLPYMARELFNAQDGWEGESAAVFSCGALFKKLLTDDQKAVDQTPKDDFSLVEAIYRHLRRSEPSTKDDDVSKDKAAVSPVIKLLHEVVAICAAEPAARYTFRALLADLRLVGLVARGQLDAADVEIGRVNQVSRFRDKDVLLDRSAQLAALEGAFLDVLDSRRLKIGHVFGASGSGKSRLVEGWTSHVQEEHPEVVVVGAKLDPKVITPLPTFTSIFEGLLDRVSSSSSGADWPGKADVQSLLRAQPKLSMLLSKDWRQHLIGDDRKDEQDEDWSLFLGAMTVACKHLLQLLTARAPCTIIVIDDAQWASADERQLWRSILDDGARLEGLLVLSIHRSETDPPQSARLSDTSALIAEALPLSFSAISEYLQEAFRFEAMPSILTTFIFRETGGNAFYVRRLLAQLVDKVFQFDYGSLSWQVDLGALPTYAVDGIDQFVARAVADVSPDTLKVLQSLTLLPTRDIEVSLLAALHPQLKVQPLLAEAAQRGILLSDRSNAVRWAHDKLREAAAATIAPGDERRRLHQDMGRFLLDRPAHLFDAADNFLEAREGLDIDSADPELSILLCTAAQASLRASTQSADRYLSAAGLLMDYTSSLTWEQHPETCFSYILAKAELSAKLNRVTQASLDEIASALPKCRDLLGKLQIWTVLVRMTSKSMPQTSLDFGWEAFAAAGYSFEAEHDVPTTSEDFARIERLMRAPVDEPSAADQIPIALSTLIGHFVYPCFMALSFEKQTQVAALGVALASTSAATLRTASSAYAFSWYGHQRSSQLEIEKASRFNSIGARLLAQFPGSPYEADTRLTLDLQLHLTVPMREIDYLPSWEIALRSGNYRMASFSLVLGSASALMAGRFCLPSSKADPGNACFGFPGWEEWLPLLISQSGAYMAAFRKAVDNLVSPTASGSASFPLNGDLVSPDLVDPANPLFSLAAAALQLHAALLLEAPDEALQPVIKLGEDMYFGAPGMPLHYEWAFLRSMWRIERDPQADLSLVEADIVEIGHITNTSDWRCRIALLRTKLRLREASAEGLIGLIECAAEVEQTSALLAESCLDGWSIALLSRYAKSLRDVSGSPRLAVGFASAAAARASDLGAFGLARLCAEGFEPQLVPSLSSSRMAPPHSMSPPPVAVSATSTPMVSAPTDDLPQPDDKLDSRLQLSTVLRSLVLIAAESDPDVLLVRVMRILLQFTRADFGALALRENGSDDLLLRVAGDFEILQPYQVSLSSPLAASLGPASTMLEIDATRAVLSSRKAGITLQEAFFKSRAPAAFVGIPLQNGHVLFLSGADFLLDLSTEGSQSMEVVGALINVATISLDSSLARRSLETTVSERTAALKQALEAERSFLSVVSHELRTPLFSVLGLVTVLETSENLDDLQLSLLAQVRSSGEDLSRLINQVLDYSRLQSGVQDLEQIEFDLRDLVEEALDAVAARAQRKDLELSCATCVSDDLPILRGDAYKAKQCILNFLSNAIKFTDVGFIRASWALGTNAAGERTVEVSVTDSGRGLSAEQQKRLFKSFSQADASILRSHGGFGLGLSISRQLARALGGDAWVESEVGKGSTFTFSFKASFSDNQPACHPFEPFNNKPARRALLYCPPPTLRDSLVQNLEAFGLVVDTTSSDAGNRLKDELEVLTQFDPAEPDARVHYDLILLSSENVDVGQLPLIRQAQPGAKVRILPRMINAAADASRLEIPHSDILSRPLKARALYQACRSDEDLARTAARKKKVGSGAGKTGQLSKDFADKHPIETILFVDDNAINVSVGLKILAALGYRDVDTASDGKQAVEATARRPYELVLLDLQMPVLDGFSAAKAILSSSATKDHPMLVALTANSDAAHRDQSTAVGFANFLSKPLNIPDFKKTLADVSGKKRAKVNSSTNDDAGAVATMTDARRAEHSAKEAKS